MISRAQGVAAIITAGTAVPTIQISDVRLLITRTTGGLLVALPGTREDSISDWARDLDIIPLISRLHWRIGLCHAGCLDGAELVLSRLQVAVGSTPWIMAAHSLGAGMGTLLAAMMALSGQPPSYLLTCGAMRSSLGEAVRVLLAEVKGESLRNAGDPVVDLPPGFTEWRAQTQLGNDCFPHVQDHFIVSYAAAVA